MSDVHIFIHFGKRTRDSMWSINQPPRMDVVWSVLEKAKSAGDNRVANAARRLINAHRLGWKKHAEKSDIDLVFSFR